MQGTASREKVGVDLLSYSILTFDHNSHVGGTNVSLAPFRRRSVACAAIDFTMDSAVGRLLSRPTASPQVTATVSRSFRARACAYLSASEPYAPIASLSRSAHSSVSLFFRKRNEYSLGQGTPRSASSTFVLMVESPVTPIALSV